MGTYMSSLKLNRFITLIQPNKQVAQSPSAPSPNDILSIILAQINEWPVAISNHFSSILPPETLSRWLAEASHWLAVGAPFIAGGALLMCFLCCCLPAIVRCLTWVLIAVYGLIRGLVVMVGRVCMSVFRCLCCCARGSRRMMKAPGRGGKFFIERAGFESNPAAYFQNLRAGGPVRGR